MVVTTANENESKDGAASDDATAESQTPAAPPSPREDRLFLPDDRKLRPGLVFAFDRILRRAAAQVERVDTEPAVAVHEFRKSVRRARALLALLRPTLRKRHYRKLANDLRAVHRATSPLRDSDVLLSTLDRLHKAADDGGKARSAAEQWRTERAQRAPDAPPSTRAAHVLREAAARLPRISVRFERALPRKTSWKDVARGLRRTFARAQAARRSAVGAGKDDALHDWRKRTKELNYQLETLTRGSTIGPIATRKRFADLAEALGKATDQLVLREALERGETTDSARYLAELATRDVENRRARLLADSDELMANACQRFVDDLVAQARSARRALISANPG